MSWQLGWLKFGRCTSDSGKTTVTCTYPDDVTARQRTSLDGLLLEKRALQLWPEKGRCVGVAVTNPEQVEEEN